MLIHGAEGDQHVLDDNEVKIFTSTMTLENCRNFGDYLWSCILNAVERCADFRLAASELMGYLAERPIPGKPYLLKATVLLEDSGADFQQSWPEERLSGKLTRREAETAAAERFAGLSKEELMGKLRHWEATYQNDAAGAFKCLANLSSKGALMSELLRASTHPVEEIRKKSASCNQTRNYSAHTIRDKFSAFHVGDAVGMLSEFQELAEMFPGVGEQALYNSAEKTLQITIDQLRSPRLRLADLRREYAALPEEQFNAAIRPYEKTEIKEVDGESYLYLTPMADVRNALQPLMDAQEQNEALQRDIADIKTYFEQMLSRWGHAPQPPAQAPTAPEQENAPEPAAAPEKKAQPVDLAAGPLTMLLDYTGGVLGDAQLTQLFQHSLVLGTPAFWLEPRGRAFLAGRKCAALLGEGRAILMDDGTRMTIDKGDEAGNEQAHRARIQKNGMEDRTAATLARLAHLPVLEGVEETTEANLLFLTRQFPEKRFCLLTTLSDRPMLSRLAEAGTQNLVPIRLGGELAPTRDAMYLMTLGAGVREMAMAAIRGEQAEQGAEGPAVPPAPARPTAPSPLPEPPVKAQAAAESRAPARPFAAARETPGVGAALFTLAGEPISLTEEVNSGGEATIYKTSRPGIAAKIYLPTFATRDRYEKLCYMVAHDPGLPQLCWPMAVLVDGAGGFVGFLMKLLPAETATFRQTVMATSKEAVRKGRMEGWDLRALMLLCAELCRVLSRLPEGTLIGDINPGNFILNYRQIPGHGKPAQFWIVDCDSFQIKHWRCPVGTGGFVSPRIYREYGLEPCFGDIDRLQEDENFAVATLLFMILMMGKLPYSAIGGSNGPEAILAQEFAYPHRDEEGNELSKGENVPDGSFRILWSNMNGSRVREYFGKSFIKGESGPPAIGKWVSALEDYAKDIEKKRRSNEIMPVKYFDPTHRWTADYTCSMCGKEYNMRKEKYEKLSRRNGPILCGSCYTRLQLLGENSAPRMVPCRYCGAEQPLPLNEVWYIEEGYKPKPVCDCCNETVSRECATPGCRSQVEKKRYEFAKMDREGLLPRCPDCLRWTSIPCENCGEMVEMPRFRHLENESKGWQTYCGSCLKKETRYCAVCGCQVQRPRYVFDDLDYKGRRVLCDEHKWKRNSWR